MVTGNIKMIELIRPFNALDVALKRKDTRMANILRRAGAPPGSGVVTGDCSMKSGVLECAASKLSTVEAAFL